jgi:hypothetical protein
VFMNRTVLILESSFALKSFASVREALSNAFPGNEVTNKAPHRLVTKLRIIFVVSSCCGDHV